MKRIVLILLLSAAIPLTVAAQKRTASKADFQTLYDKYSGKEHFTTIEVGSEMLKLLENKGSKQENRTGESRTFDGIDRIRIVISEKADPKFIEDLKNFPPADFKLMWTENEGGQQTRCYIREDTKNKHKSEFIAIITGDKNNLVLSITGEIDLKSISGLSGLKIKGMDQLRNQK